MQVSDCMITTVYTIGVDATVGDAMRIMAQQMVGTLPVVDAERHMLGVVLLDDVLAQFMPQFVEILRSVDFVHDYGVLEAGRKSPHMARRMARDMMRPPYAVTAHSGLMAAMVLMHKYQVGDIPVVNEHTQLVGLASYVRVGSLFLMDWLDHFPQQE